MSSFTRFSGELQTHAADEASDVLGTEYYWVDPGFEYYLTGDKEDRVIIERGYLTDGASVPKLLQWLIQPWGKHGQCAVVHDKLCETWATTKRKLNRKEVDEIFFQSLKIAKVNVYRRLAIEIAVTAYRHIKRPTKPTPSAIKQAFTAEYNKK